ncbi:MAG: hypothetical protein OXH31_08350 [Gammaproteobacteria bacterium]|nr:hypothetical protein [Gammaproteobacteria bacterium]
MDRKEKREILTHSVGRRTEPSVNEDLAAVLNDKLSWTVTAQLVDAHQSGIPDIVISEQGRATVALENEINPAQTVRKDAESRLGTSIGSQKITNVVELRTSELYRELLTSNDARDYVHRDPDFRYALLSGLNSNEYVRFPTNGYLRGNIDDLTSFIRAAGVPSETLNRAINILEKAVSTGVEHLAKVVDQSSATMQELAELLCQDFDAEVVDQRRKTVGQALGIVATIILNAMAFQQQLAGIHNIESIARMRSADRLNQSGFLVEWQKILDINYWSIFALAKRLLESIRIPVLADQFVLDMASSSEKLASLGLHESHDLAGTVFQRFIVDRKYLASFYTRTESATLLANLALPAQIDPAEYLNFKMADFACGTGTLIHAAYSRASVLNQLSGGDSRACHKQMIEKNIVALDIVSSAAHLTASMLSSVFPSEPYENTNVMIPRYGADDDNTKNWEDVALGSLELIRAESKFKQLFPSQVQYTQISGRRVSDADLDVTIDRESYNLVIMNPPFTRAAADWDHTERAVKQYRGLGTTQRVQDLMAQRQRKLFRSTCFDGYAGLASAFPAIADAMLRNHGCMAFVLPFTSLCGARWRKFREMISKNYGNTRVISISQPIDSRRSFSADTDMAECLLIATKGEDNKSCTFVNLYERPASSMVAAEIARAIRDLEVQDVNERLSGGTPVILGDEVVGVAINVRSQELETFGPAGIKDLLISQVIHSLREGVLRLPLLESSINIPIAKVGLIAQLGLNAANIAGGSTAAFRKTPRSKLGTFYPMIWLREGKRDTSMVLEPDFEGVVQNEARLQNVWSTRSWAHFGSNIRVNSQALAACFTEDESLGGSGWPNVKFGDRRMETAFVLWSNSTLGLLLTWYFGPRQYAGRVRHGLETYAHVPTLNVRQLGKDRLNAFVEVFEEFRLLNFEPMHLAYRDPVRIRLDRAVLVDCLGLDEGVLEPLDILRRRWCGEPTVYANRRDGIEHEREEPDCII